MIVLLDGERSVPIVATQRIRFVRICEDDSWDCGGRAAGDRSGAEKRLIDCLVKLASAKAILSAHDVSDGGLAVTLAESCFGSDGLSADVDASAAARLPKLAEIALFGERGARAVVSLPAASLARVEGIAAQCNVQARRIGTVTRGEFRIQYKGGL